MPVQSISNALQAALADGAFGTLQLANVLQNPYTTKVAEALASAIWLPYDMSSAACERFATFANTNLALPHGTKLCSHPELRNAQFWLRKRAINLLSARSRVLVLGAVEAEVTELTAEGHIVTSVCPQSDLMDVFRTIPAGALRNLPFQPFDYILAFDSLYTSDADFISEYAELVGAKKVLFTMHMFGETLENVREPMINLTFQTYAHAKDGKLWMSYMSDHANDYSMPIHLAQHWARGGTTNTVWEAIHFACGYGLFQLARVKVCGTTGHKRYYFCRGETIYLPIFRLYDEFGEDVRIPIEASKYTAIYGFAKVMNVELKTMQDHFKLINKIEMNTRSSTNQVIIANNKVITQWEFAKGAAMCEYLSPAKQADVAVEVAYVHYQLHKGRQAELIELAERMRTGDANSQNFWARHLTWPVNKMVRDFRSFFRIHPNDELEILERKLYATEARDEVTCHAATDVACASFLDLDDYWMSDDAAAVAPGLFPGFDEHEVISKVSQYPVGKHLLLLGAAPGHMLKAWRQMGKLVTVCDEIATAHLCLNTSPEAWVMRDVRGCSLQYLPEALSSGATFGACWHEWCDPDVWVCMDASVSGDARDERNQALLDETVHKCLYLRPQGFLIKVLDFRPSLQLLASAGYKCKFIASQRNAYTREVYMWGKRAWFGTSSVAQAYKEAVQPALRRRAAIRVMLSDPRNWPAPVLPAVVSPDDAPAPPPISGEFVLGAPVVTPLHTVLPPDAALVVATVSAAPLPPPTAPPPSPALTSPTSAPDFVSVCTLPKPLVLSSGVTSYLPMPPAEDVLILTPGPNGSSLAVDDMTGTVFDAKMRLAADAGYFSHPVAGLVPKHMCKPGTRGLSRWKPPASKVPHWLKCNTTTNWAIWDVPGHDGNCYFRALAMVKGQTINHWADYVTKELAEQKTPVGYPTAALLKHAVANGVSLVRAGESIPKGPFVALDVGHCFAVIPSVPAKSGFYKKAKPVDLSLFMQEKCIELNFSYEDLKQAAKNMAEAAGNAWDPDTGQKLDIEEANATAAGTKTHKSAASNCAMLKIASRRVLLCLYMAVAGAGKSDAIAEAFNPDTDVWEVPTKSGRADALKKIREHHPEYDTTYCRVKTFIRCFATEREDTGLWNEMPNRAVTRVWLDEAFRLPTFYLLTATMLYPEARFALIGDYKQINVSGQWYPSFTPDRLISIPDMFDVIAPEWRNAALVSNVTYRFGAEVIRFLREHVLDSTGQPWIEIYTCCLKETTVEVYDSSRTLADMKDFLRLHHMKKNSKAAKERETFDMTSVASQGLTFDVVVLALTEDPRHYWRQFPSTAYVELTRGRDKVILQEAVNCPAGALNLGPLISETAGYRVQTEKEQRLDDMGLDVDYLREIAYPEQIIPKTSVVHTTRMKKMPPVAPKDSFQLADFAFAVPLMPNTVLQTLAPLYHAPAHEAKRWDREAFKPTDFDIKVLSGSVFGKRWFGRSRIQMANTLLGRLAYNKRVRKHAGLSLAEEMALASETSVKMINGLVDKQKLADLLNPVDHEARLGECWTDWTNVCKFPGEQQKDNVASGATRHARVSNKQQTKAKSDEAATQEKGGQPIMDGPKVVNTYQMMFARMLAKVLPLVLKDHVKIGEKVSKDELYEHFMKHATNAKCFGDLDQPNFDATQRRLQALMLLFTLLRLIGHAELITKIVFGRAEVRLLAQGLIAVCIWMLDSGNPFTFIANVVVSFCTVAACVELKFVVLLWVAGDDIALGFSLAYFRMDMRWFRRMFIEDMKISVSKVGVMFCNEIYTLYGHCYDPRHLMQKICSKNFSPVLTQPKWDEYIDSLAGPLEEWRYDQCRAMQTIMCYHGVTAEHAYALFHAVDAFANMSFEYFQKYVGVEELVVSDYLGYKAKTPVSVEYNYQVHENIMSDTNYKNKLQELCQSRGIEFPVYDTTTMGAATHVPRFSSSVRVAGITYRLSASKSTKVESEQAAAKQAFENQVDPWRQMNAPALSVAMERQNKLESQLVAVAGNSEKLIAELQSARGEIETLKAALSLSKERVAFQDKELKELGLKVSDCNAHMQLVTEAFFELDRVRGQEAEAWNTLMHALNGNVKGHLMSVRDMEKKSSSELRTLLRAGLAAGERVAVQTVLADRTASMKGKHSSSLLIPNIVHRGRALANYELSRLKNRRVNVLEVEADKHNSTMHAENGNNDLCKDWIAVLAEREMIARRPAPTYAVRVRDTKYLGTCFAYGCTRVSAPCNTPLEAEMEAAKMVLSVPDPERSRKRDLAIRLADAVVAMIQACHELDGFDEYLATHCNQLMHALNGNTPGEKKGEKKSPRKGPQSAEKQAARKVAKKEARKVTRKLDRRTLTETKKRMEPVFEDKSYSKQYAVFAMGKKELRGTKEAGNPAAIEFLRTVVLPGTGPVERFSGSGTGAPTAVASLVQKVKPAFTAATPTNDTNTLLGLDPSSTAMVIKREAGEALIFPYTCASATVYNAAIRNWDPENVQTSPVTDGSGFMCLGKEYQNVPIVERRFVSGDKVHDTALPGFTFNGRLYSWYDKDPFSVEFTGNGLSGSSRGSFTNPTFTFFTLDADIWQFTNGAEHHVLPVPGVSTAAASTQTFVINSDTGLGGGTCTAGYYAIDICVNDMIEPGPVDNADIVQVFLKVLGTGNLTQGNMYWAHRPIATFRDMINVWGQLRIIGMAGLCKNIAAPAAKTGEFAAFQVSAGEDWRNYTKLAQLTTAQGNITKRAETGLYAWLKPISDADMRMRTDWQMSRDGTNLAKYDGEILSQSPFVVAVANITAVTGFDSSSFEFTHTADVEYDTSSQIAQKVAPRGSAVDFLVVQDVFRKLPTFWENPTHEKSLWERILGYAKMAGEFGAKYGPQLINAVKSFAG